jgi:hypothetical protein
LQHSLRIITYSFTAMQCSKLNPLTFLLVPVVDEVDANGRVVEQCTCPDASTLLIGEEESDESDDVSDTSDTDGDDDQSDNAATDDDSRDIHQDALKEAAENLAEEDDDEDSDATHSPAAAVPERLPRVEERLGYAIVFPSLDVRLSRQGTDAGMGVFVATGHVLEPWDAIPLFGNASFDQDERHHCCRCRKPGRHSITANGMRIDGDPAVNAFRGVGHRGAAIAALVNEPTTVKSNCVMMGSWLVVARRITAGQELLVSYGPGAERDYKSSRYTRRPQHYRQLGVTQ